MVSRLSVHFTIAVILAACLIAGCSSGQSTSPVVPAPDQTLQSSADDIVYGSDNHSLWGFWWVYVNPAENQWEIVPARDALMHTNIRGFLEDGPCTNCFQITSFVSNPDGSKSVDIQITHPWPGLDRFTGFDVRAIAMWNGSEVWPTSGLRTQDPDSTDGYVLNPDGYTTVFNPTDFAPGDDIPLFSYSKGRFASPAMPDSTLNPYIDYYTDEFRHFFRAGESVTKTWEIRMPSDGPFVFGYAIDACWAVPDPNPPVTIPEDFTIHANRPEPWAFETSQVDTLDVTEGADGIVEVKVWDWQDNPGNVWIECPDLWDGHKEAISSVTGVDYTIFTVGIANDLAAGEGMYRALVGMTDGQPVPPPWDLLSYTFMEIEVVAEINQAPVSDAEASSYSVYTGENIDFTSLAIDPDGLSDIEFWRWDFENDDTWDTTQVNPTHSYDTPGVYEVDHQVTDYGSLSDDLEPDDLLEITVIDYCCESPPVAAIGNVQPVVTGQWINLVNESTDPDGDECIELVEWDTDGDGSYDETGEEVTLFWNDIGSYDVTLRVTDSCGLSDTVTESIDVHVGVVLIEDQDYKTIGTQYSYVSGDFTVPAASFAVDMTDIDGPWDFTQLGLEETGNYRAVIDKDHPEVSGFSGDFVAEYDHLYKTEGIYNFVSGAAYIAEGYTVTPEELRWVGIHETDNIGSVNFSPVMTQSYPFWIYSAETYSFGFAPIFTFDYELRGWGEGEVTIPWNSITDEPCVVVAYMITIASPSLNGGALVFEWLLDDGTCVAVVAAINDESNTNFDETTWEITGVATFNALDEVGPYPE